MGGKVIYSFGKDSTLLFIPFDFSWRQKASPLSGPFSLPFPLTSIDSVSYFGEPMWKTVAKVDQLPSVWEQKQLSSTARRVCTEPEFTCSQLTRWLLVRSVRDTSRLWLHLQLRVGHIHTDTGSMDHTETQARVESNWFTVTFTFGVSVLPSTWHFYVYKAKKAVLVSPFDCFSSPLFILSSLSFSLHSSAMKIHLLMPGKGPGKVITGRPLNLSLSGRALWSISWAERTQLRTELFSLGLSVCSLRLPVCEVTSLTFLWMCVFAAGPLQLATFRMDRL